MNCTIGVVVATYNGERFIETQLLSIINQTKHPNEIIVSDGCSADNTIQIAKKILSEHDIPYRILTSDKRLSVSQNFQKGLSACETDYIFFSDQDDMWLENKIERTLLSIEEDCSLIFTNAYIADENLNYNGSTLWQQIGYRTDARTKKYSKGDLSFYKLLIKHNVVTGMCMCISSTIKPFAIPFPDGVIHDYWIAFVGISTGSVISINEPLTLYRQHGNNVVGTTTNLRKSYSKKDRYLNDIIAKEKMITQVLELIKHENLRIPYGIVTQYKDYLDKKIQYITSRQLFPVPSLSDYYKYEYKMGRIVIRDIFTKVRTLVARG